MSNALKGDPDYAYGQAMLALRTAVGLTQEGLANHLGITRRAVGEWEAGGSYPKADHLKEFIVLAVQRRAFTAENVAEEIRTLWQVTHQKEIEETMKKAGYAYNVDLARFVRYSRGI